MGPRKTSAICAKKRAFMLVSLDARGFVARCRGTGRLARMHPSALVEQNIRLLPPPTSSSGGSASGPRAGRVAAFLPNRGNRHLVEWTQLGAGELRETMRHNPYFQHGSRCRVDADGER